jgi:hypothetical protein
MMNNLQKMGGVAALIEAATFVVGLGLAVTLLAPYMTGDLDPVQTAAFLVDNQSIMYLWNQIIFVVFGVFLVILALALYERLKAGSPAMAQTATAFGLIWAGLMFASGMVFNIGLLGTVVDLYGQDPVQAGTVGLAIRSVEEGLGGGNEIVGSLWVLLVSWAALQGGGLPRALNYFGVLVSVAGLLTVVPSLEVLGFIFGLGSIGWFVWLGIVMLRGRTNAAV